MNDVAIIPLNELPPSDKAVLFIIAFMVVAGIIYWIVERLK